MNYQDHISKEIHHFQRLCGLEPTFFYVLHRGCVMNEREKEKDFEVWWKLVPSYSNEA